MCRARFIASIAMLRTMGFIGNATKHRGSFQRLYFSLADAASAQAARNAPGRKLYDDFGQVD